MSTEHNADDIPQRSRGRRPMGRPQKLLLLAVCALIALAVLILSNMIADRKPAEEKSAHYATAQGEQFRPPPREAIAPPPAKPLPAPPPVPASLNLSLPTKPHDTPVLAYTASGAGDAAVKASHAAPGAEGPPQRDQPESDGLAVDLRPASIGGTVKAVRLKNPDKTIGRGTQIHCSLQTAINSQLRGFVTCLTSEEVRSVSGKVTLMDRGSLIFGEVKQGLRQGQDRLFILWTAATIPVKTGSGVDYLEVALDSPAADELGRAGAPGQVNTHFWQRFGAALLFSVIDYGPTMASSALQRGNGNSYTQFYSPQQQVANTILQDTLNIPPTLEKNQGETLSVFVARNLDFSNVIDLVLVGQQ